jgi:hypothetical protein
MVIEDLNAINKENQEKILKLGKKIRFFCLIICLVGFRVLAHQK